MSGPNCQTKSFAEVGNKMIGSSIMGLTFRCYPLAIFFAVVAIIVNSVDLQTLTVLWVHIYNKIGNIMPPMTNQNATATIIVVAYVVLIVTSVHHGLPYCVNWMVGFPVFSYCVDVQTTATTHRKSCLSQLTAKLNGPNSCFITTITKTFGKGDFTNHVFVGRNNNKSSVFLVGFNRFQGPIHEGHKLTSYNLIPTSYQVYG